jgi:hypothetical protein
MKTVWRYSTITLYEICIPRQFNIRLNCLSLTRDWRLGDPQHLLLLGSVFLVEAVDLSVNRRRSCIQRQPINDASVYTEQTRNSTLLIQYIHICIFVRVRIYMYINCHSFHIWKQNITDLTNIQFTVILSQFWTLSIVLSFISNSTQLYGFVRTSQETHYVSATSPSG